VWGNERSLRRKSPVAPRRGVGQTNWGNALHRVTAAPSAEDHCMKEVNFILTRFPRNGAPCTKYTFNNMDTPLRRLHTGWTVRGSHPGRDETFRTFPDRRGGPPSLLYNGYWVFPGGKKRPGRDADPSPPSSDVVKKG
jgi:hypothetical protein